MSVPRPRDGEILEKYKNTLAHCWRNDGRELLLLRGTTDESYLERHAWPDDTAFVQSDSNLWASAHGLAAATRAPYAAVIHVDEGESGIVVVDLRTMNEIRAASFISGDSIADVAFSPDDRLLVVLFEMEGGEPYPEPEPGQVTVGSLQIAVVGEWDYLEVPLTLPMPPGRGFQEIEWPSYDTRGMKFIDDRRVTLRDPWEGLVTLDVEQLRTDPRWLEARAMRRQAEKEERDEERRRLRDIDAHNQRALTLTKQLEATGLTCPYCSASGKNFKVHPGTSKERALILCPGCSRTLPI